MDVIGHFDSSLAFFLTLLPYPFGSPLLLDFGPSLLDFSPSLRRSQIACGFVSDAA